MHKDTVELLSKVFSLSPSNNLLLTSCFALLSALYGALLSFVFAKKLKGLEGRQAQALKELEADLARKTQSELQRSQAALTEEHSKKQSRLDYEYEARKRLYHECEPLIFELLEFSEIAGNRIRSLARTARQGELPNWLSGTGYYMTSTIYLLFAPVAVYKLMRRRLTIVDLSLDRNIANHYRLAKQLALSFVHDFFVSSRLEGTSLAYDPNNSEWKTLRATHPEKYWRQGLPYGRFDNAVESLIIRDSEQGGTSRVRSFGEFESAFRTAGSEVEEMFSVVQDLFIDFHPARRPVLWRLLVIQAHIHESIVHFHRRSDSDDEITVSSIPEGQRQRYYWDKALTQDQRAAMEEPFKVAEGYFKVLLPELWKDTYVPRISLEVPPAAGT